MLRFIAMLLGKEYKTCESCIILEQQIKRIESQNTQLMDRLLKLSEPELIPQNNIPVPQKPRIANWNQARKELEAQDRVEAATMKKIAETEAELGIGKDATKSTGTES